MAIMTKNKSLALTAASALALTGLSAVPAQAAESFTTAPVTGSSYGAILGSEFVLVTTVANAEGNDLKYLVDGVAADADIEGESEIVSSKVDLDASTTVNDATDDDLVEQLDGEDVMVFDATDATAANPYSLFAVGLVESEIEEQTTITVTPFIDSNDDDVYDSELGEVQGDPVSITFYPTDEVDVTASFTADANADEITPVVAIDNVNMGAIRDRGTLDQLIRTKFTVAGSVQDNNDLNEGDFDSDENALTRAIGDSVGGGDRIAVEIFVGEETDAALTLRTNLGETDAADFEASAAGDEEDATNNEIVVPFTNTFFLHDESVVSADTVRAGDGTLTVYVEVDDAGGSGGDVVAGETVSWEITETGNNTLDSDASITANGETLTNGDTSDIEEINVTSTTDEDGKAYLTISYSDLAEDDVFQIEASIVNSGITAATRDFNVADGDDFSVVVTNTDTSGSLAVGEGDSYSVDLAVRDEFGIAPDMTTRVALWIDYSGGLSDVQEFVEFDSNGFGSLTTTAPAVSSDATATLKMLDIATDDGSDIVGNELDKQDSDGDYGNSYSDVASLTGQTTVDIIDGGLEDVVEVEFVTAESHDDDTAEAINGGSLYSLDTRVAGGTELADATALTGANGGAPSVTPGTASTYAEEATALVTDINGAAIEGAAVTFSMAGAEFTDESGQIQSVDSITVYSKDDGTALVGFITNTAGEQTMSVTSGGQSDELDVDVAHSTDEADIDSWDVEASENVMPGSTLSVTATALDEFGNYVDASGLGDGTADLSVTYDGPGIVIPNDVSAIYNTSATGEVKLSIIVGSNDSGSGTVTFTMDADETPSTTNVVQALTFTIGEAVGDYGTQKAWTVNQDDGTAKVYVKFPEIDGKLRILHQTGGSGSYDSIYSKTTTSETMDGLRIVEGVGTYVVRTIDLADGTNRIRVSVDGEDIEVNGKDRPARYNE